MEDRRHARLGGLLMSLLEKPTSVTKEQPRPPARPLLTNSTLCTLELGSI